MARRRALAILDVTVKAAALGLAIYPIVNPSASHFAGKAMGVRALIYPLALLAIPAWWYLVGRPQPYPFVADIAFAMPFLVDSAGNVLGLFAIAGFDALPHAFGWLCLTAAFGLAVAPMVRQRPIVLGLCIGFGATIDILWEIGEFLLQRSGSSGLQLTYENTIQDLAMSLLGSVAGAILVVTVGWPRGDVPRQPFGWQRA